MKPETKYRQHVVELSKKLPEITEKQKQWAFEHCFEDDAYYCKGEVWCLHCGERFPHKCSTLAIDVLGDAIVCPNCGRNLKLKNCRKTKHKESWYYTILTTFRRFQVCRHFIVEKQIWKVGSNIEAREPFLSIQEAVQNWIDENGMETIIARPCKNVPHVYDAWDFSKPMEYRVRKKASYTPDKYDIHANYIYPWRHILPKIKRNGYSLRFDEFSQSELYKLLLTDREAEILAKNNQFDILRYKWMRNIKEFCMPYAHSIKVANRNKYIVKDTSMWFDYLEILSYLNLDTHNAHYVCPENLQAEHDRLLKRKERIVAQREREKELKEARKWENEYRSNMGKYFGVAFGNQNIMITVIQSVAEMAEEGTEMHHCVYSMGYYKKQDSLILSAKDKEGNRIETIEVSLKTFKVLQSRGVCNTNTDKHDEIIQLVNKNINLIKQIV